MNEEKEEYVGAWLGDKPMGWGLLTYKNDDFYLGEYILSLFHKGIFFLYCFYFYGGLLCASQHFRKDHIKT